MNESIFGGMKKLVRLSLVWALLVLLATEVMALEKLDLDKAVKVGSGKTMVIEFTDPDCPFCRKAEAYFQKRTDITRYIFFIPLKSHPASKGKVQYILSSKDKAKAYREASSDAFDPQKLAGITQEGIKLQQEHAEIARDHKMNATPTFIIYGRIVTGFDQKKLESLLK